MSAEASWPTMGGWSLLPSISLTMQVCELVLQPLSEYLSLQQACCVLCRRGKVQVAASPGEPTPAPLIPHGRALMH